MTNTLTRPLTDYEREAVAAKVLIDLRLPDAPAITREPVGNEYITAGHYELTELGGLTPAFGTVTVTVAVGRLGDRVYVNYDYRWDHRDGERNGYLRRNVPVPLPLTACKAGAILARAVSEAEARGTLSDDERLSLAALYQLLNAGAADAAARVLSLMAQPERELIPHAVRVLLGDETAPAEPDAEPDA